MKTQAWFDMQALGGSDVNRAPVGVPVEVINGEIRDMRSGERCVIVGSTVLRGWGEMDGPAHEVSIGGCAVTITVPIREWDRITGIHARK